MSMLLTKCPKTAEPEILSSGPECASQDITRPAPVLRSVRRYEGEVLVHTLVAPRADFRTCGDFALTFRLSDGSLCFFLGDAVDHNQYSRALSREVRGALRALVGQYDFLLVNDSARGFSMIAEKLNCLLCSAAFQERVRGSSDGALLCLSGLHVGTPQYDLEQGEPMHRLTFLSAGNPPALIRAADEAHTRIAAHWGGRWMTGTLLGVDSITLSPCIFSESVLPESEVLLVSDGAAELFGSNHSVTEGMPRVAQAFDRDLADISDTVVQSLRHDDASYIAVRIGAKILLPALERSAA